MEKQYGRRLGKTVDMIEQIEVSMSDAPIGTVAIIHDVEIVKRLDGYFAKYIKHGDLSALGGGVMDVLTKLSKVRDAAVTVAQKGTAYNVKNGRLAVQVWSKDYTRLDTVKEVFGGNYYRHGSGFVWACSKRADLVAMWKSVRHLVKGDSLAPLEEMYEVLRQSQSKTAVHPARVTVPSLDSGGAAQSEPQNDNRKTKVG